jgi:hypothetical protein
MLEKNILLDMTDPDEVLGRLLDNAPNAINDAVHDHLLVEKFFPSLDETFKTRHLIRDEEVENFKKTFDYNSVGIKEKELEALKKKVEKVKSIDRVLSIIEKHIPDDLKKQIVVGHLRKVWIEQNYSSDLRSFISSLNNNYWNLK